MNIKHRPQVIDSGKEFGHYEGNLMLFGTQKEGKLLNLVERKSRFSMSVKLEDKRADPTATEIIGQLKKLPKHAIKSITFDRGGGFVRHQKLKEELTLDVWYCGPLSPWQRGSIENTNGSIGAICHVKRTCLITGRRILPVSISCSTRRRARCWTFAPRQRSFSRNWRQLHDLQGWSQSHPFGEPEARSDEISTGALEM